MVNNMTLTFFAVDCFLYIIILTFVMFEPTDQ